MENLPPPPAIIIPPVAPQIYLHHTTLASRPKIILLGDSITELGAAHPQGWGVSLGIRYNRRADVVHRGMNGYNSRWGLAALPLILQEVFPAESTPSGEGAAGDARSEESGAPRKKPRSDSATGEECLDLGQVSSSLPHPQPRYPQFTFLIVYGANDSCLPDGDRTKNHVPLDEYASNLKRMIQMIRTWNEEDVAVALLTPPPCDTEIQKRSRHNEHVTKLYAEACAKVASEVGVPVVDLWTGMQLPLSENKNHSSFERDQQWKADYLSDGLHLTPLGNYRLYELVVEALERPADVEEGRSGLGLPVSKLPRSYPDHSLVDAIDPEKTFRSE